MMFGHSTSVRSIGRLLMVVATTASCVEPARVPPSDDGNGAAAAGGTDAAGTGGTSGAGGGAGDGAAAGTGGSGGDGGSGGTAGGAAGSGGATDCPPCTAPTPHCNATTGRCVECTSNEHCAEPVPACDPNEGACASRFVGSWRYVSGNDTFVCPGSETEVEPAAGTVTIEAGMAGRVEVDRSLVVDSRRCVLEFDIVGDTATLVPKNCSEVVPPTDLRRTMNFTSWVMKSADGQTMTLSESHTISVSGDPLTCTSSVEGTLERVWADAGSGGSGGTGGAGGGPNLGTGGGAGMGTAVTDLGEACEVPEAICGEESSWCAANAVMTCDSSLCTGAPGASYCSKVCTTDADCTGGSIPMRCSAGCSIGLFANLCWDEATYAALMGAC